MMGEQSWNNRAALPASNTLTFTRRAEAAISNSDTKLGVLHPLCELPSAYFPIELAADGDAEAKKKQNRAVVLGTARCSLGEFLPCYHPTTPQCLLQSPGG